MYTVVTNRERDELSAVDCRASEIVLMQEI
jgi:hypothetical protein